MSDTKSTGAAAATSQCAAGAGCGDGACAAAATGAAAPVLAPGQASFDFRVPAPAASHALHSGYFHPVLKKWANDQVLSHSDLMYPVFVVDDDDAKQEIRAMPGQYRWGVNRIAELLTPLVQKGLQAIILFGVLGDAKLKDRNGSYATNDSSPVVKALRLCRLKYPTLLLACDVCLCAYTDHGHCGIVKPNGDIDNTPSIQRIAEVAVFYAQNGAHCVAPSDMMDGRIAAIKHGLRAVKLDGSVNVMSYSSKFASVMYGPFRDAAASGMAFGDRSKYQLPPFSRGLALRALERDVAEGADSVMVKPGGPYLDLVRDARERVNVPIAIYHVSGEFAMLYHAAQAGAFDLTAAVMETVQGFRRAGAKIIITYFVDLILDALNAQHHKTTHPLIKSAL